jgi:hypothetical protein
MLALLASSRSNPSQTSKFASGSPSNSGGKNSACLKKLSPSEPDYTARTLQTLKEARVISR